MPIIHVPEKKDYKQLLYQYLKEHNKPLKPIKSRGKNPVPELMPAKWQILIELSQQLILQQQKT